MLLTSPLARAQADNNLLAQLDGRFVLDPQPALNDTFLLCRLRPTFEAQLGKYLRARGFA